MKIVIRAYTEKDLPAMVGSGTRWWKTAWPSRRRTR